MQQVHHKRENPSLIIKMQDESYLLLCFIGSVSRHIPHHMVARLTHARTEHNYCNLCHMMPDACVLRALDASIQLRRILRERLSTLHAYPDTGSSKRVRLTCICDASGVTLGLSFTTQTHARRTHVSSTSKLSVRGRSCRSKKSEFHFL